MLLTAPVLHRLMIIMGSVGTLARAELTRSAFVDAINEIDTRPRLDSWVGHFSVNIVLVRISASCLQNRVFRNFGDFCENFGI